jgi:putative peptide zinc metalloprotease protein
MNTFDPTAEQLRETTVPEWNTQNALSMHDHGDAGLRLRRDLAIATAEYPRREHVVIDEISGRFTHIPETLWQSLTTGTMGPELRIEASLAGWMRTRFVQPRRRFNPLAIQIPIVSIDSLAAWLAPRTNWLFGLRAVILWITLMLAMVVTMLSRTGHWQDAMVRLPQFVSTFHPLMMIVVFVVTKAVHELAHAVVCRRMGARCGHVGVWILCGFVCPYCDVTDTWRVTDWRKRAAVMAAGIYTELVVASLAVVGWLSTDDISWRLVYVYVLLVCGVSTLVFNANPLMRYDGYHILSDLIASVHLRRDASEAWQRLWFRIVGGPGPERTWHQSKRGWFLIA